MRPQGMPPTDNKGLIALVLRHGFVSSIAICIVLVFAAGAIGSYSYVAQSDEWLRHHSASGPLHKRELRMPLLTESGVADLQEEGSSDWQVMLQGVEHKETGGFHELIESITGQRMGLPQREVDPQSEQWDNSVAVCAIMKKERITDVREWLLYHRWLGVDKIYLRENTNSTGPPSRHIVEAFQGLVDEGFLDLGTWGGQSPKAQQLWYNRCAQADLAGAQSWILFSDLDEYPVLMNKGVAMEEPDLKAFMRRHRGAAGLTLQWVMFGSSGHRDRPQPGGPLRHFDKCSNTLSFEMKCFAASHHLSEKPFIGPTFVHACCYKYNKKEDQSQWPPVLYGDGTLADATKMQHVMVPVGRRNPFRKTSKKTAMCRSYRGHLKGDEYRKNKSIPQGEALVLFHYMTRSFQDFRERKLSRYAGMYVDDFKERRQNATALGGTAPSDEQLFDALEHDLGIDKAAAVCSSAVEAQYASKCCE